MKWQIHDEEQRLIHNFNHQDDTGVNLDIGVIEIGNKANSTETLTSYRVAGFMMKNRD
jgi:hypothetical protein